MTESEVRHSLFTLLVLYTLVGIDLMSTTGVQTRRALQGWVAWGTAFVLIGFLCCRRLPRSCKPAARVRGSR